MLELLSALAVALVAVAVGLRLLAGELGLSTALLVLILTPEAYWPLRQLGIHYHGRLVHCADLCCASRPTRTKPNGHVRLKQSCPLTVRLSLRSSTTSKPCTTSDLTSPSPWCCTSSWPGIVGSSSYTEPHAPRLRRALRPLPDVVITTPPSPFTYPADSASRKLWRRLKGLST